MTFAQATPPYEDLRLLLDHASLARRSCRVGGHGAVLGGPGAAWRRHGLHQGHGGTGGDLGRREGLERQVNFSGDWIELFCFYVFWVFWGGFQLGSSFWRFLFCCDVFEGCKVSGRFVWRQLACRVRGRRRVLFWDNFWRFACYNQGHNNNKSRWTNNYEQRGAVLGKNQIRHHF